MKKAPVLVLVMLALLLASPLAGYAGRTRVSIGANLWLGPPVWWGYHGWGPRFYAGAPVVVGPWYPYYYYPAPPVAIQQQPPVHAQPEPQQSDYWYYCQNPQGYYPYVQSCPGGWMKVVPQTTPPQQ